MPSNRVRIDLPQNAAEKIKLAQTIATKHAELGAASPLAGLQWSKFTPAITTADEAHKEAKQREAQAEAATERRDTALELVDTFVRAARDVLSGVHAEEMRKLGDYGFSVNARGSSGAKKEEPAVATVR